MTANIDHDFTLAGRVAVVTGGAGLIGFATASAMARHGADVAIVDVDEERAAKAAETIAQEFGRNTIAITCDVSDAASVENMVASAERQLGPISILHNNAASKVGDHEAFFESPERYDIATWRAVMSVNLDGMFLVTQRVGAAMAERNYGSIIHTASIYGATMGPDQRIYEAETFQGVPMNTPPSYVASKAGVTGLTLFFSTYWARQGVRVNTISPGGVQHGHSAAFVERYSNRVPMGRMANVADMAGPVVFLASDAASYITGQNLHVDGGLSAW